VKLEFLDINLNTWSMIVFFFYAIFLICMTLSVFGGRGNPLLFLSIIITFIMYNTILVLYAISTSQIGFILIVVFQFFLTLMTFIYLNGDREEMMTRVMDDEDED
jgi:hypothetical protein